MIYSCFRGTLIVLTLIAFLLVLGFHHQHVQELKINGQTVTISRDEYHIPTINAPSFSSAMYAWGYVTAEDRLFQMAFRRKLGQGKLSEYVGEKVVKIDKMFRELNFYGWAQKTSKRFEAENKTQYDNFKLYCQGINDHVKSLRLLPMDFYFLGLEWEEWKVVDMINLYKLLKWSQSQNANEEYVRSMLLKNISKAEIDDMISYEPKYWIKGEFATQQTIVKDDQFDKQTKAFNKQSWQPQEVAQMLKVGLFDYIDDGRGSNSWVIGGKFTESGHPLMANDPHLDSAFPSEWHQVRVFYEKNGKEFYIKGGAMTGLPAFTGKTPYVSIAITTTYSDSQDLYKQTINDKEEYLLDGKYIPLKKRMEVIKVKGGQEIEFPVYETHRGPLIRHFAHGGYLYEITENISLCWAGFIDVQFRSLAQFSHIAEVQTFEQWTQYLPAMSDHGPTMNFIYITKDDHFGYQSVGPHPLRAHPHHGMYIKDGSTTDYDWRGFLRDKQKLSIQDPERGYIVTANNKPSSSKFEEGIFDISILTARADRLQQMVREQVAAGKKFTKDDMKRMQTDTIDVYCKEVVKKMNKRMEEDSKYIKVFKDFKNFDCNFSKESTTSSIYIVFIRQLYDIVYPGENKQYNLATSHPFMQYLYRYIMQAETTQQLSVLEEAIDRSHKILKDFFKTGDTSKYKYSEFHKDMIVHRPYGQVPVLKNIYEGSYPGWGNWNTPNVGKFNKYHSEDYGTYHRANIRTIISYYEDSQWIIDTGISQKFYSKHYSDQLKLFLRDEYLLMDPAPKSSKSNQDL